MFFFLLFSFLLLATTILYFWKKHFRIIKNCDCFHALSWNNSLSSQYILKSEKISCLMWNTHTHQMEPSHKFRAIANNAIMRRPSLLHHHIEAAQTEPTHTNTHVESSANFVVFDFGRDNGATSNWKGIFLKSYTFSHMCLTIWLPNYTTHTVARAFIVRIGIFVCVKHAPSDWRTQSTTCTLLTVELDIEFK